MSTTSELNNPASSSFSPRRFVMEGDLDGEANMSRDAELLDASEVAVVRMYGWSGPWVTLGKGQDAQRDLAPSCPVPNVVRPTGGRAVLHGHDITLGIMLQLRELAGARFSPGYSRQLKRIYRDALLPLVESLAACGVPAALGEALGESSAKGDASDCFLVRSSNDIVDQTTGRKVCGVAMKVTQDRVLLQCSIPVGPPLVDPGLVFAIPAPIAWIDLRPDEFVAALKNNYELQ